MSESAAVNEYLAEESAKKKARMMFFIAQLPYVFLYILSIVLVAITDSDPSTAADKWYWFVPVIAVVAIYGGWKDHAGTTAKSRSIFVLRQALHWSALVLVTHFLFRPDMEHFLNAETQGFVMMYLLGLASILEGVHSDWKMGLFGLFVTVTAVVIGWIDDNAMMLGIVSSVAALGIVAMFLIRGKVKNAATG